MTQDQIMELVQVYASAWALVGSRFDNGNGMADALEAKAEVVAALDALTKDAARYHWLRHGDNDEAVIRQYREGGSYLPRNEQLDEAIDYVIAVQKEQV